MKKKLLLVSLYLVVIACLFLYSFTQVDLSLTLSRFSVWQVIQRVFQHIGYFDRPLSTYLYVGIVLFMSIFYIIFLLLAHLKKVSTKDIWVVITAITIILALSYNAFSHDLFNYVFDAKIITHYSQNPYEHKALDYPGDPMLSFMHWTHRTYPYGPTWLFLTVPLSFLGLNFFLPTVILFKMLLASCFLGSAYFVGKIAQKITPGNVTTALVFFAFNPLILIESMVSSHNDIAMIFLVLVSFYFLVNKKFLGAFLFLTLSIGIKFATAFLIPVFLLVYVLFKKKKEVNWGIIFLLSTIIMIVPIVLATMRTNFQPWYLLNVLPFAAFVAKKHIVAVPACIFSVLSLCMYIPYLYLGNWDPPAPTILFWIVISALVTSALFIGVYFLKELLVKRRKSVTINSYAPSKKI